MASPVARWQNSGRYSGLRPTLTLVHSGLAFDLNGFFGFMAAAGNLVLAVLLPLAAVATGWLDGYGSAVILQEVYV